MRVQTLITSLGMFFCFNYISRTFSFMGRNRKSLGGQWGEAVMTQMMAEHQSFKHNKGKKNKKNSAFSFPNYIQSLTNHHPSNSHLSENKDEPLYKPRTPNQELYLRFLTDKNVKIVLGVGPAGCGKTLFACHRAIEELRAGNIKKIVVTRPMVAVEDESVGFLPGDMNQKMAPWTRPIFDIFGEYYDSDDVNEMVRRGIIEISPLAYMRGRTFKDAFIIADEMQNSTPNQMLMVTTRLGQDSKMVITGDLNQSDRGLSNNGLLDLMRKLRHFQNQKEPEPESFLEPAQTEAEPETNHTTGFYQKKKPYVGIKIVQLESFDVCRSPIVSKILDIYQLSSENEAKSLSQPIPLTKTKSLPLIHSNTSQTHPLTKSAKETYHVSFPIVKNNNNYTEDRPISYYNSSQAQVIFNQSNDDCALIPKKDQEKLDHHQCHIH